MVDARLRRIAENESRFREINERLESDLRALPADGEPVAFVCECGHAECVESVPMTVAEYEHVREDPLLFVMLPGHEILDAEDVLARTDRYLVVRKKPATQPMVEESDPRNRS